MSVVAKGVLKAVSGGCERSVWLGRGAACLGRRARCIAHTCDFCGRSFTGESHMLLEVGTYSALPQVQVVALILL